MIIKFEPHSFILFLTMSMGMSYAVLNLRTGLSFWKLIIIALVIGPFLWVGISRGHIIDIALGAVIAFFFIRGDVGLLVFDLFDR